LVVLFVLVEHLPMSKDPLFLILVLLFAHFVYYKMVMNLMFKPLDRELDLQIRALEEIYNNRI